MHRRFMGGSSLLLVVLVPALHAQVIRGVVRDSSTKHALAGASVLVASGRDSSARCSASTDAGQFKCAVPARVALTITIRHVGYEPITFGVDAMAAGDSVDLAVTMSPAVVTLDPMLTIDTSYKHGLFWVTPGRVQFERHMALGKGHFISSVDVLRSGMRLSDYLVAHFRDSLKIIDDDPRHVPVVPVAQGKFLTSAVESQCLYIRIDRLGLREVLGNPPAIMWRDRLAALPPPPSWIWSKRGDNIDDFVKVDEIAGVELYLHYHDVPPDWRMDAYPTTWIVLYRYDHRAYPAGSIGLGSTGVSSRGGGTSTPPLTCPLLQIWTRIAW